MTNDCSNTNMIIEKLEELYNNRGNFELNVAIDLDGTIAYGLIKLERERTNIGLYDPEVIGNPTYLAKKIVEFVTTHLDTTLWIFSARYCVEVLGQESVDLAMEATSKWMNKFFPELENFKMTNSKNPKFDVIIDDRAYHCNRFESVYDEAYHCVKCYQRDS